MATSSLTVLQASGVPEFNDNINWQVWKEQLEIHFGEIKCEDDSGKKTTLLKSIGSQTYSVLRSICDPDLPVSKTFDELCKILDDHFTPPTIIFRERKSFHSAAKKDEETISQWYARVKKLALQCKFGSHLDAMVLDQFVIGLPTKLFEKLCEEDETITIEHALRKALIMESKLASDSSCDNNINFVKHRSNNKKNRPNGNNKFGYKNDYGEGRRMSKHSGGGRDGFGNGGRENASSRDSNISDGKKRAACDTGAPCVLIPHSFYRQNYGNRPLEKCSIPYVNYSGDKIPIIGEYVAEIQYKSITKRIKVVVTATNSPPLLGRSFLRAFEFDLVPKNMIKHEVCAIQNNNLSLMIDQIKNEFSQVFSDGLGTYKGEPISLDLAENAKPIFFKPRPIPFAWKSRVEEKLHAMVKDGILEQVNNSAWGTALVPVLKPNGDFRICGDYKVTLNKFLSDFKYPLQRIDEIFTALQGGSMYTKLDLSNAYNQLVLDEESQMLCAVSTHIGVFKVMRLPFGVKVASAIFQKTIDNLLGGIPNVVVYQDDITVTGKDFSSHMHNLKSVLRKLSESGLRVNYSKCKFFQQEINYLGFCISSSGLRRNTDRVSSIINAPVPNDISELRAFIGLSNYYSRFVQDYSEKMEPLYSLLRKDTRFVWSDDCQRAYDLMKREITSDSVLTHFNPSFEIILTTDASSNAVSGILSHIIDISLRPIAFVSMSLSKSEKGYSTLEKEALGIIFSVCKLRQYLLGNKFTLRTDHRPLTTIFGENKSLPMMASARIQRWAVILSAFNYSIEYVKGTQNEADGLSRIPQFSGTSETNGCNFINLIETWNEMELNFKDIARETGRDPILSMVREAVLNGTLNNLDENEYTHYRSKLNELHVEYECVLWGHRVVIPNKVQSHVLNLLHRSHLGIVKTKGLARSYVWWPGIDKEIERLLGSCKFCQESLSSPERSLLIPWQPTDHVWSRIHLDYAGPINGYYILIIIDSYSKFVEVFPTKSITSHFTETKIRELFCRYGLVDIVVTDNGRQFTCETFREFLKVNGVRHVLTPPGHPATNGQAEITVKTIKKSLIATLKSNPRLEFETVLNRCLIDYRNSKHSTTGESPAKLFFGRSLRTRLSLLKPPTTKEIILANQQKTVLNDKGTRDKHFSKGQSVIIRDYRDPNKPTWAPAKIKSQIGPRSYSCIFTHNDREIKRHLDQIRGLPSNENTESHNYNSSDENIKNHEHLTTATTQATNRDLRPRKEGKVVKPYNQQK
ncbi:uncharacterized protein K02A2.6-like [Stomoxys calcitrans]|uniref:uncharacterized protein K02A2.6-like n=1 Tax=Stomoxys calcitrans TaxID=35570 RepID=UPI0027E219D3|nr:uncharacterized protein K02A2.6-like [Stomoxys calcitrans]